MVHNKIYYIQPKPYFHGMLGSHIIKQLIKSDVLNLVVLRDIPTELCKQIKTTIVNEIESRCTNHVAKPFYETVDDVKVAEKLLYYINEFFYLSTRKPKTRRVSFRIGKFTQKQRP
jgi:hypothetical protein